MVQQQPAGIYHARSISVVLMAGEVILDLVLNSGRRISQGIIIINLHSRIVVSLDTCNSKYWSENIILNWPLFCSRRVKPRGNLWPNDVPREEICEALRRDMELVEESVPLSSWTFNAELLRRYSTRTKAWVWGL